MMRYKPDYNHTVKRLTEGKIIAYPTEAVFGLGCDPFNEAAVKKLLIIKGRDVAKGLILIASDWSQVSHLVAEVDDEHLQKAFQTWPGPYTWVFPASHEAPKWITGDHETIAIRITDHPIAKALCDAFEGPIVSTSANRQHQTPAKSVEAIKQQFGDIIDDVVPGEVGDATKPSTIRDVLTGEVLR